ncbi:MAG TPA: hypothetical protein VKA17_05785 [Gammaproteobacteria bacterium]|nr:hypothetical protein [Gammaproteobacteria bacterium]
MRSRSLRLAFAAPAVMALAAACALSPPWWQAELREWEGVPVSELLDAWGPPLRMHSRGDQPAVLVYERTRELDYRIEALADPGAPLDASRGPQARQLPGGPGECTLFFRIEDGIVAEARHEGGGCDIVPRDPARRRVDPQSGARP